MSTTEYVFSVSGEYNNVPSSGPVIYYTDAYCNADKTYTMDSKAVPVGPFKVQAGIDYKGQGSNVYGGHQIIIDENCGKNDKVVGYLQRNIEDAAGGDIKGNLFEKSPTDEYKEFVDIPSIGPSDALMACVPSDDYSEDRTSGFFAMKFWNPSHPALIIDTSSSNPVGQVPNIDIPNGTVIVPMRVVKKSVGIKRQPVTANNKPKRL